METPRDIDTTETREWQEALDDVIAAHGEERASFLLQRLLDHAYRRTVPLPAPTTPYVNTIPASEQPPFPGDRRIERRIKSLVRWNAMAMVVRANRAHDGIGGHIATYQSAATLYEVGFNHFFRGRGESGFGGDLVYFQGHASPGIYARAFLEGRLTDRHLLNFRRELEPGGGLSSYPHPWLMPDFWEFPTVSMGLGPISAIYQARFMKYLENRGLAKTADRRVWAFLGDGETDEPETLGALTLASREALDNLTFVVNCNLQRLDGPVRGNGKIIQELEAAFRGAGWNVIKVLWGASWDPLLERDKDGWLARVMTETVDGEYQKYSVEGGAYIREHFFGRYPELAAMVADIPDEKMPYLRRGGHDPEKVYAAYKAATETTGQPTVILAMTIKGYGLGHAGQGMNVTHQQKKLHLEDVREFRDRFEIPIPDDQLDALPFYRPPAGSEELEYMLERRRVLGGPLPERRVLSVPMEVPSRAEFAEFHQGINREVSTTMAFVQILRHLLKDEKIGDRIVPIVPDEARTFGMESLFRQYAIYSSVGQLYEPVDSKMLLLYKEAKDGQILEEGITEAGSMCSFTAAGTAHSNHGLDMIPFFIYYSMFGFQRIGDLIWAFGDLRGRGFLLGGTAGRTTLNGEGLQHEDGHSHILAAVVPNVVTYDPAFAYELAVIIEDGLRRMYVEREEIFYYLTLYNENYVQPPMPEGAAEGILKGLYLFQQLTARWRHAARAAARLGVDVARVGAGPGAARRPFRRGGRRLERDFLQGAASRSARMRTLEPVASRRPGPDPLRDPGARRGARSGGRGERLPQARAGPDRALGAAGSHAARHRRFRAQRDPGRPAPLLRDRRRVDRAGGPRRAREARRSPARCAGQGARRARHRPRQGGSDPQLTPGRVESWSRGSGLTALQPALTLRGDRQERRAV